MFAYHGYVARIKHGNSLMSVNATAVFGRVHQIVTLDGVFCYVHVYALSIYVFTVL